MKDLHKQALNGLQAEYTSHNDNLVRFPKCWYGCKCKGCKRKMCSRFDRKKVTFISGHTAAGMRF